MQKVFLILIFCFSIGYANGQFVMTKDIENLHGKIIMLDSQCLNSIETLPNTNGLKYWLLAYNDFLSYHFGWGKLNSDTYFQNTISNLNELKSIQNNSPFYNFCMADVNLFLFYSNLQAENYWSASKNLFAFQHYVDKNVAQYPNFYLNARHQFIQLAIDVWIMDNLPILSFNTNSEAQAQFNIQFDSLLKANISNNFMDEIKLLGVVLNRLTDKSKEESFNRIESFGKDWPTKGPLQALLFAENTKQLRIFNWNQFIALNNAHNFNHLCNPINLLMGEQYLYTLNDSCLYLIDYYIQNQQNKKDILHAKLLKSWYYFISDQKVKSEQIVNVILSEKDKVNSELDKQAVHEVENFKNWNKEILKARLLYDGGNYKKAQHVLLSLKSDIGGLSLQQKTEYSYRLARIYDELNDWSKALVLYNIVISSGFENYFYYPAYAAYYVGVIYQKQNSTVLAQKYFSQCQKLNSPVYARSIHQKAKHAYQLCEANE